MKKQNRLWLAAALLLCALVLVLMARRPETVSGETAAPETAPGESVMETIPETGETAPEALPDSMLYYGTVLEVIADEQGHPIRLRMDSPRYGPYVFFLGVDTCYVDSGEHTAFDPGILQAEDRVYVVCSPITMRSMPPQSQAFVILRNIPMDASCAMYHEAEEIRQEEDRLLITTDNGSRTLEVPSDADIYSYEKGTGALSDLQEGDFFLAWYWDRGEERLRTPVIMLLP